MDLVDDEPLDLGGVVADDLHLVELGPQVEDHVVHAVDVDDLPHKGVGHHVQAEGGQHDHHNGPLQRQHDVLQLHRPEDLFLQNLGQGVGPSVGVPQAVGDSGPYPVDHAEEHDGDELLLQNDLHLHMVEHPQHQGVEHRQENDVGDLLVPQGQEGAQQHQQGQTVENQGVVDPHKAGRRHGQSGEPRHHEAVGQGHPVYRNTAQYAAEHQIEQRQETAAFLHGGSSSDVQELRGHFSTERIP